MGGWNVVSVGNPNNTTPAPAAPPAAAAPPTPPVDPWAVTSVGGAPPPPAQPQGQGQGFTQASQQPTSSVSTYQPTAIEKLVTELRDPASKIVPKGYAFPTAAGEVIAGGVKDTFGFAGTMLDLLGKASRLGESDEAKQNDRKTAIAQGVQKAADWLRSAGDAQGFNEGAGALGAEALQWFTPELFGKLAGTGAVVGEKAITAAEHLKATEQLASVITKHPKAAGYLAIGMDAARAGSEQAAFQYAHNENPTDAALAGGTGAILHVATRAMQPALAAGMDRYGSKYVPMEGVEGGRVQVSPQQLDEAGRITDTGAETPKIARGQQQAFQQQFEPNMARKFVGNLLGVVNESRPAAASVQGAREAGQNVVDTLADRAGEAAPETRPFTFRIETSPTEQYVPGTSVVTGQPEGVRIVKEPGAGTRAVPAEGYEGPPEAAHATTYPPATVERPEGGIVGTGMQQTTDVNEARNWIMKYDEAINHPGFDSLPKPQQDRMKYVLKDLKDQLSLYHATYPNARFDPIDIGSAVSGVNSPGTAAAMLDLHSQPVYDKLNELSNGDFNTWRDAENKAKGILEKGDNSEEVTLRQERLLAEARANQSRIFDFYGDQVNPTDYRQAKLMQRGKFLMSDLDTMTKRMANGVTPETTATRNLSRYVKGDYPAYENWLTKDNGENERDLTRFIGKDGVDNYGQMFKLLDNPPKARKLNDLIKQILTFQNFHANVLGVSGTAVHLLTGLSGREAIGATAGIGATAYTARKVFQFLADNPKAGGIARSAVDKNIAPKLYAPLITRMFMQQMAEPNPTGEQRQKQEQQEAQPQQ